MASLKAWQGSFIFLLTTLGCRTTATMSAANLLAYSEQFANPTWGAGNVTVVDNAAIAPDRSQTAARLTETATYSWHGLNQGFAYAPGTVLYVSVSMKAGVRTKARLNCANGNARFYADFDLAAGTVVTTGTGSNASGTGTLLVADIVNEGNGWYRLRIKGSVSGTLSTLYFDTELQTASGQSTNYYQGDGTSGLYIWGASVSRQSWTYVRTTAPTASALP
jgi:hypothetical protein